MKEKKTTPRVSAVLLLLVCLCLLVGCTPKCFRDEEGYWTTENGEIMIDEAINMAKIVIDEKAYYFGIATNPPGHKIWFSNDYPDYVPFQEKNDEALLGLIPSYQMGSGKFDLTFETDNYFDYTGKTVSMKLVPYSDAPENVLRNDSVWVNLSDGSVFFFSNRTWKGTYEGAECDGNFDVFPTDEVMEVGFVTYEGTTPYPHSYLAEVTEKNETEITFKVIASKGVFADRLGESFVLTKQTDAESEPFSESASADY